MYMTKKERRNFAVKSRYRALQKLDRLIGKTAVLTGATGGLGIWLCRYLLDLGAALILINRNPEKAEKLRADLLRDYPNGKIELMTADMEVLSSVENVCQSLESLEFDYLILNAGAYAITRRTTAEGYDNVFGIDFVSPYYMVHRLLPVLRKRRGRVIAVGSIAHNYSHFDPADIDFSGRNACNKVYGNAKRFLMFSLHELFRNESKATLSLVHPGITFTGITDHYPKWLFFFIKYPMKVIFMQPKKAALCLLQGMFEPTGYREWIGPRWFDIWGKPKRRRLHTGSETESRAIFEQAEKIYRQCAKNCY